MRSLSLVNILHLQIFAEGMKRHVTAHLNLLQARSKARSSQYYNP